jgi:hypothetical protein
MQPCKMQSYRRSRWAVLWYRFTAMSDRYSDRLLSLNVMADFNVSEFVHVRPLICVATASSYAASNTNIEMQ